MPPFLLNLSDKPDTIMKNYTTTFISFILFSLIATAQSPGNALNFDGNDDMVICSSVPALFSDLNSNDFTFEAWVYPSGGVFSRIIFAQYDGLNFATMSTSTSNQIYFYVIVSGSTYSVVTNNAMPLNQWTHVAARWNSTTLTPEVLFNGILQGATGGGSSSTGTNLMTIGTRPGGAQYFNGALDEVRLWNVARTDCEIVGTMNSEFTVAQPNLIAYYNFNQGTAGGNNTGITALPDINATYDGTLTNFALSGSTSNWITSGAVITETNHNASNSNNLISGSICQGDSTYFSGQYYSVAGVYSDTLTGSAGCDSIVTLDLTISPAYQINLTETACDSFLFGSQVLTTSGIYTDSLTSASGCDSVITLNLAINTVDVTISQSLWGVILANDSNATYQWLNCMDNYSPYPGETNQSFMICFETAAVQVSNGVCVDTSECEFVVCESINEYNYSLDRFLPNPTDGMVYFTSENTEAIGNISITDMYGKQLVVYTNVSASGTYFDLTGLPSGLYFVDIERNNKHYLHKIIRR